MAIKHLARSVSDCWTEDVINKKPSIVSKATTADEVILDTTLGRCVEDAADAEIKPPAIVVVGEVVRLRAGLDWVGALGGKLLAADPLGTRTGRQAG